MTPIRIFEGSFSGATVFENAGEYIFLCPAVRGLSLSSSAQADGSAPLFDQGLTFLLISFRRRRIRYACCSPCDDEAGGRSQVPRPKDGREDAGLAAGGEATRRARARGRQGVRLSAPIHMCTFIIFISVATKESSRIAVANWLARARRAMCLCVAVTTLALIRTPTAILVSISALSGLWRCLFSAVNQNSGCVACGNDRSMTTARLSSSSQRTRAPASATSTSTISSEATSQQRDRVVRACPEP